MLLEILLLPIETTDMLLKEAPAWSTITSNKSFDITFLFTLPSLINTVLLVVAVSFLYSSPPAIVVAGEKLPMTKWIKVDKGGNNEWRKILSLKKNDSVLFELVGNSFVNQPSVVYFGSISFYNGEVRVNIKNLAKPVITGYTEIKYKDTHEGVDVWVSISMYSRIKLSILLGDYHELPMTIEEPPIDAILVQ